MANSPQAIKRARQNKRNAERNRTHQSRMRTSIKKLIKAIQNNQGNLQADFTSTTAMIDHTASKGIIHRNKAARLKSRLNKKIKAGQAAKA